VNPDLQLVANPDRRGRGVGLAMGDGDQDFVDANLFGILARAPTDIYEGLTTFLIQNLDIQPADAFHEAGAQHLHDGFFGGPASGESFVAVLPLLAIPDLFGRVDPIDKCLGVPLDHFGDSSNLDDVCSKSDNHGFCAFKVQPASKFFRILPKEAARLLHALRLVQQSPQIGELLVAK
jgi:hypothetical protein